MKKFKLLLIALVSPLFMWAQNGLNYQAVVRDGSGNLLLNQAVVAGFKILESTSAGTVIYEETHNVTTNDYGLVNAIIGEGTVVSGDFTTIDWGANQHFLAISIDGNTMGTIEFKSVPYSLHAQTLTNIKTNTTVADIEITSTDEYATLHIRPTANSSNDSSAIFLSEGSTSENGMAITYNGVSNALKISGRTFGSPYIGPYLTIKRDSGISTFSKGVVINETTSTPTPNTTYGNSGPLAYGYINGAGVVTDFGIASVANLSTGVYEIVLDNNWVGSPVVVCTSFNNTPLSEVITYNFSGTNTITVRIVNQTNTAVNSNFSLVVYGIAQ